MRYNPGEDRENTNEIVGSRFVAASTMEVTHLGFYDEGADGLSEPHRVAIFEGSSGAVIAEATIPAGNATRLEYNCRWVELDTAVSLVANETYVIAAEVFSGGDPFINSIPNVRESTFGADWVASVSSVVPVWKSAAGGFSIPENALGNHQYNRSYFAGNFASLKAVTPVELLLDPSTAYQSIESFGASDAWNLDFVGKHWSDSEKELMAKRLFSLDTDELGNPEGIGLSGWRFNIGAGSAEQGEASDIVNVTRRAECFLQEDGTYDWNKQLGQQWFLGKAREYGVSSFTAFSNSAPVYYTKNGLAHGTGGATNLKDEHYDEFAIFLATVLKHFQDEGKPFDFISPVNEPQYAWSSDSQEGSHWETSEIARLARELDTALLANGVTAKQTVDESGQYDYTYPGGRASVGHIESYFDPQRGTYIGNLGTLDPSFSAHSYWTVYTNQQIVDVRDRMADELDRWNIPLRQTEYSLLGLENVTEDKPENDTDIALFMAKVIHADLTVANAISWAFWTSAEQDRFGHKNRFLLMTLQPNFGTDLTSGGTHRPEKTLWMLGNYSRFVRPGYKRINLLDANGYDGILGSAYLSPEEDRVVVVLQNNSYESKAIRLAETGVGGISFQDSQWYLSDRERDLRFQGTVDASDSLLLPARSLSSLVVDTGGWEDWVEENLSSVSESLRLAGEDPDSDGIANLLEYAAGVNPVAGEDSEVFAMDDATYVIRLDQKASDVRISVEYSNDLKAWQVAELIHQGNDWTLGSGQLELIQSAIGESLDELRIRRANGDNWFYRIKGVLE